MLDLEIHRHILHSASAEHTKILLPNPNNTKYATCTFIAVHEFLGGLKTFNGLLNDHYA